MPTEKFNIGGGKTAKDRAATPAATGGKYAGPTPPSDTYKGIVRFLKMAAKPNKNGDPMLKGGVVINEPATSAKAKYNGYVVNFNLNISDQGVPFVNQFLDAISGGSKQVRERFWDKGVQTAKSEADKDRPIVAIGGLKVPDKGGFTVTMNTRPNNYTSQGKNIEALQVGAFLLNVSTSSSQQESAEEFDEDDATEDFDVDEDTDDTDDEVEADDEVEVEDDADAEDEADSDDEEAEEDEDESEEVDEEEQRKAGYVEAAAGMDRAALRTAIKKLSPTTKILTRHKDDDLRATLVELQMTDPPF